MAHLSKKNPGPVRRGGKPVGSIRRPEGNGVFRHIICAALVALRINRNPPARHFAAVLSQH
jgi:hypothetical protein